MFFKSAPFNQREANKRLITPFRRTIIRMTQSPPTIKLIQLYDVTYTQLRIIGKLAPSNLQIEKMFLFLDFDEYKEHIEKCDKIIAKLKTNFTVYSYVKGKKKDLRTMFRK